MKGYYVFGINANNFIELDEYPENHREKYIEELKDIHIGESCRNFLDRRDHMDMEYFIELNNLLKMLVQKEFGFILQKSVIKRQICQNLYNQ